ncbi:MAG: cysteine methyltransferase [Thermoprotei archaeon]|nr:MAG: cysteine methyltransferase [Thermoprotei archaeon]RLF24987.1 MAG: cysteine methyltransferase [Thermoprotei archaeon]
MGEGFNEKVALDISGLSSRELAILELTKRIPRGKVTTYRRLALKAGLGNAWRYIGRIMARNRWPLIIPCHRVVRSDGSLGGYIQGFKYAKVKEEILRREGVVILRGRVLKEYIL